MGRSDGGHSPGLVDLDEIRENMHEVDPAEEMMLQDLFLESPVFKFFYFQNDEFTRRLNFHDL